MTWIKTISREQAVGRLAQLYERMKGPHDQIDNIMLAHSLRPHSLAGHMTLYRNVLHHPGNSVDKWRLELLGVYTSMLNRCAYCVEHHSAGFRGLLDDDERAGRMLDALADRGWSEAFDTQTSAALIYAEQLTRDPSSVGEQDVEALRSAGWNDGEILEINQVVSYFNYANRTVLGLGVSTEGDILGLSPSDSSDEDNWQHRAAGPVK